MAEQERLIEEQGADAVAFIEQSLRQERRLKEVLYELKRQEAIKAQDDGTIVFMGGYIIARVEEWRPQGKQIGWTLHPLDTLSAVMIDELPKHAVLFRELGENVIPKPGDIFVYKRAGESLGVRISAQIIKDQP